MGEGASRAESETRREDGASSELRRSHAVEICSVAVDVQADGRSQVILVLDKREQRQRQEPMRLVKSMRHAMTPACARHVASLLQLAADRAESLWAEAPDG